MRKMGLFWFAAALLGAALIFAGCESPTSGSNGAVGAPGAVLIEGNISAANLQAIIDVGVPLLLANANITGAGVVNFGTANVTVAGKLTTATTGGGAVFIFTPQANLTFVGDASIDLGGDDDYFIGTAEHIGKAAGPYSGNVTSPVGSEAEITTTLGSITAVENLILDEDAASPPVWYTYDLTIFVYGTLTVKGNPVVTGNVAKVVAIKDVLIDAGDDPVTTLAVADEVDVSNATITLDKNGEVTVTLPTGTLSSPTFNVTAQQGVLKVTGPTDINAHVTNSNGVVEFVSGVTKAVITGNGRVRFADTAETETAFTATGSVFPNIITAGIIEFPYGFSTSQYATVALNGDVYIGDGTAITLGATAGTLTLGKGSTIKVGTPGVETSVQLLSANNAVKLTAAAANAALTASAPVTGATPTPAKLALSGADLTLDGYVSFISDVEFAKGVTFNNTAFFADDTKITLTHADGIITLKKGAALARGAPAPYVPNVYSEIIGNKATADVDLKLTPTVANIVLTFGSGGSITQSSAVAHGITITGIAGLTAGATYTVASEASVAGTLKIDANSTLELADGLLASTAKERELGASALNLAANSSLVLAGSVSTTDTSAGATIKGCGASGVKAGATTITGEWQAVGVAGTNVTIKATAAAASSITASAATVALTAGTGATITQAAVADNNLTIGEDTAIVLGGDATAALGKLILTGGATPAKLVFEKADSAAVQVGATFTTNTEFGTAAKIGGHTFGGTAKPEVYTSVANAAGTFLGLKAGADGDDLTGGDADNTITIDSTQAVAAQ
jgi:hypothetical protein